MKIVTRSISALVLGGLLASCGVSYAQRVKAQVLRPESSMEKASDVGVNAHTNLLVLVEGDGDTIKPISSASSKPITQPFETPASIGCLYGLTTPVSGCTVSLATENPSGGSRAIAIVDAFDDPNAQADLAYFSEAFGLPAANFEVVYAQGTQPKQDPTGGWELEESLDIEWAHAMAPYAKIYLVEAADNSFASLFAAAKKAAKLVAKAGGGEVSMSFGGSEFKKQVLSDGIFNEPKVVYIASAGDNPGPIYPSTSPNVLAAGGTTISRNEYTGVFRNENTWQDAGGGSSTVELRPTFQDGVKATVGDYRGVPDLSFDANPYTGVLIYDSNPVPGAGFYIVGGTSVSAPSLAGILNSAGSFELSSQEENTKLYNRLGNGNVLRDITYGNCGYSIGSFAEKGWDFCTGVGSVQSYSGK